MPVQAIYKNIARVVRPHGSKGEVVVAALRGLPFLLREGMTVSLTPPALKRERFPRVVSVRPCPDGTAIVRFSCADGLDGSEPLAGCYVLARAEDVELGPLDAAFDDLIGRDVVDARYGDLGRIREVMETPANDVWVVEGDAYGEVLIPVIDQVIPEIPDDGPIEVSLMDGLVDAG